MNPRRTGLSMMPIHRKEAHAFIAEHHRHHRPPVGEKFCLSVVDEEGEIQGVATVGRPVARMADDGWTAEVTRVCTTGKRNVCSMLYGAARRIAKDMGYKLIITYTLSSEPGTSLKASGWTNVGTSSGGSWSRPSRSRENDLFPQDAKTRWEAVL